MAQIQFSLIKKIKTGRPEHSLNPHPLTSDNISFLPFYQQLQHCCFHYKFSEQGFCRTSSLSCLFFKKIWIPYFVHKVSWFNWDVFGISSISLLLFLKEVQKPDLYILFLNFMLIESSPTCHHHLTISVPQVMIWLPHDIPSLQPWNNLTTSQRCDYNLTNSLQRNEFSNM